MVSLKLQRRLAASVLKCGKKKVWLSPENLTVLRAAKTRASVRSLIASKTIRKQPENAVTRSRIKARLLRKRAGRSRGIGTRKGTANARMSSKLLWMRRSRVLRRLIRRYRDAGKIDKHLYATLYKASKGNQFRNKRHLLEHIHEAKNEQVRLEKTKKQAEALRNKTRDRRRRRAKTLEERIAKM
ncbi:hypothetical protein PCE1_001583 [Barthelona sp. PCE]